MRETRSFSLFFSIFLTVLLVGTALMSGCAKTETAPTFSKETAQELGQGETSFLFSVTSPAGERTDFLIRTDADTVGKALAETGLIEGVQSEFGLMVLTVNGETLRFEEGGHYWAFYENGAYAMQGIDTTPIAPEVWYELRAE